MSFPEPVRTVAEFPITVAPSPGSITVTWGAVTGARAYSIYAGVEPHVLQPVFRGLQVLSALLSPLQPGVYYVQGVVEFSEKKANASTLRKVIVT